MAVILTYTRSGFGPYAIRFNSQAEAMEWLKSNEVELKSIDFV